MNVLVRDAVQNDMKQVLMLIKELAKFEKEPNAVILNEEQLVRDGFSENPKFKCFVAESNNEIIGMALVIQDIHMEGSDYASRRFNSYKK